VQRAPFKNKCGLDTSGTERLNYAETNSKFFLFLSQGTIAATGRKTDRRTHSPATHFIVQASEGTDRALFVNENVTLPLNLMWF
jgi:hypothetical protein